jgi:DivIVA domain-containing protein
MYQDRITLTSKDILEKEFKLDTRGYRPQEVDKFLDIVIRDYEEFMILLREKELNMKMLLNDNIRLKQEIRALKAKLDIMSDEENQGVSSADLLRRLSNLEKTIYGGE